MRKSDLTPDQFIVAQNEYNKLCSNDVKYFLGEYSSFEWVFYRASRPWSCEKSHSMDEDIQHDLEKEIFRVMKGMLSEALMNLYGRTNGPTDAFRIATHVSFWAEQMLLGREDYNLFIAEAEVDDWQQATSPLCEKDLKRIAEKLGYAGNIDALTVALNGVYPPLNYAKGDEIEIEADIDKGQLSFHTKYMSAGNNELWDGIPKSSTGYLYYRGIEGECVVAIRPKSPLDYVVIP